MKRSLEMMLRTVIFTNSMLLVALLGCGKGLNLSSVSVLNDPIPSGNLVAQGSFTASNGKILTGVAQVYQVPNSVYVIRLQSFAVSSSQALRLVGVAGGAEIFVTSVRSSTGSQNYDTGFTTQQNWQSVIVRAADGSGTDYGVAPLTAP